MMSSIRLNKIPLFFIIICSCTKVIDVEENLPIIDSVIMDPYIELSITDTTWYEINLYISDDDGLDDIDEVIFSLRKDSLYLGSINSDTGLCEYSLTQEDEFVTYSDFALIHTYCTGNVDFQIEKICEELTSQECQISEECIFNISESEFLYYTLMPFRPLMEYDANESLSGCGGYGKVSFQFLVRDFSGNEDLSDIIQLEICGWECQ